MSYLHLSQVQFGGHPPAAVSCSPLSPSSLSSVSTAANSAETFLKKTEKKIMIDPTRTFRRTLKDHPTRNVRRGLQDHPIRNFRRRLKDHPMRNLSDSRWHIDENRNPSCARRLCHHNHHLSEQQHILHNCLLAWWIQNIKRKMKKQKNRVLSTRTDCKNQSSDFHLFQGLVNRSLSREIPRSWSRFFIRSTAKKKPSKYVTTWNFFP